MFSAAAVSEVKSTTKSTYFNFFSKFRPMHAPRHAAIVVDGIFSDLTIHYINIGTFRSTTGESSGTDDICEKQSERKPIRMKACVDIHDFHPS